MSSTFFIWCIAVMSVAGVIIRPFKIAEAVWAVGGAILLVITGLLSLSNAWKGISSGMDVYMFLCGMMLLAEIAREEKLFEWLAALATIRANGAPRKLFALIYVVGIIVTVFLSNDATAVVLTPAVVAAMSAAKVQRPLPYLFICAFIANAASFVLPISNPANLVIYGRHMPALLQWVARFILPSFASIILTYILLKWSQRHQLTGTIHKPATLPALSRGGKTAAFGILATAILLLTVSAFGVQLGWPTAAAGLLTATMVVLSSRKNPIMLANGISWSVIPLVAGLFVIVQALNSTGLINYLGTSLQRAASTSVNHTAWGSALLVAFGSNLTNNLPAGLVSSQVLQTGSVPEIIRSAILVGIDLGPNLSITGSLATILWLVALRREGITVSAWTFLKLGFLIMIPSLLVALLCLFL